jgi:FMN phosphatase YigB (HAD superfamily)
VGDSLDKDVEGARAAGIRAILVARDRDAPAGVEAIGSLADLPSLL